MDTFYCRYCLKLVSPSKLWHLRILYGRISSYQTRNPRNPFRHPSLFTQMKTRIICERFYSVICLILPCFRFHSDFLDHGSPMLLRQFCLLVLSSVDCECRFRGMINDIDNHSPSQIQDQVLFLFNCSPFII